MKQFGKYIVTLLTIMICGCAALLLSGLVSQKAVFKNIQLSAGQLQQEGYRTSLLVRNDETYQLDNFTEARILMESLYMDVVRSPATIFMNPTFEGNDVPIEALLDIADTGVQTPADTYFPGQVDGFRAVIRTLLGVMNLRQIRRLIMWTIVLLLVANVITLRRQFSALIALLFAVCLLCVNPVVIMSSIQYSTCFIIAMVAMLAMPYAKNFKKYTPPMLFFIIGGVTQFFDLYTYPVITFGLPMLVYLLTCQRDGRLLKFSASLRTVAQYFGLWLAAYAGVWLIKVGLTGLFTDFNGWESGISALGSQLKAASFSAPFIAMYATLKNVVTIESGVCLILALVGWPFLLDLRPARKAGWQQSWIYLIVGVLPLIWSACTADQTIKTAYYSYRSVIVLLFSLSCFYAKPTQYLEKYKAGKV